MSQENSIPESETGAAEQQETAAVQDGEAEVVIEPEVRQDDQLETLQQALDDAKAKAEENWNLYLSTRAEMENLRKRNERELQNAHKFALERFVSELLPVKDSLEMGIAAASETNDIEKLREGKELTLKMLASALDKFGVKEINPVGAKFNPEQHEAVAMQPSDQAGPNSVLQVIQKGYQLNERLIRPAMVIVAQAPRKG